ncbi:SufB/SufD family protein [Terricaulis sp.]|uniref:SufB/SufD family protein n=1 Tax=Terricaulis sp. TaxID=2768686 RepID=UPI002AC6FA7E|nr:SufD family Fe-S cluster assembly protein [Terricaulis sp.]MDZ4692386.1 SufD family Fe-S cluster assembly protein [Terricaulis sp.]
MSIAAELPTRRIEAWKYSDLRQAVGLDTHVLRDGRDIIERLAPGTQRSTVPAGENRLIVERIGDDQHMDARSYEYALEVGASLVRVVIQSGSNLPLSMMRVRLAAGAKFTQFVLAFGAKLARIETHVSVEGEGAEVTLNGAYLAGPGRHADLTSVIEHKAPGGVTRQLIKGVARKGGRGVFQGKIVVERGAQKTDARQYHRGLLLEAGAEIFAKPELMIHADDVQCAHGNTAGGLDESALFYMRSRGVPEAEARAMLIEAFLVEAIPEGLPVELHAELVGAVQAWLLTGEPPAAASLEGTI